MFGGFKYARNSLIILNVFYFIIGVLLIGLGGHWITINKISSLPIIGGVISSGVFLSIISVVGLIGAVKHHQVLLFFYMVILLVVFLIQFSIACACLAVSTDTQKDLVKTGWTTVNDKIKHDAQLAFGCCGFKSVNITEGPDGHPSCKDIDICTRGIECSDPKTECCSVYNTNCSCPTCAELLEKTTGKAFSVTGGVSLFFSFTEIFGAVLAGHYRNIYAHAEY